jgi:hypothetical protein
MTRPVNDHSLNERKACVFWCWMQLHTYEDDKAQTLLF